MLQTHTPSRGGRGRGDYGYLRSITAPARDWFALTASLPLPREALRLAPGLLRDARLLATDRVQVVDP
jgi:hypothetical protein